MASAPGVQKRIRGALTFVAPLDGFELLAGPGGSGACASCVPAVLTDRQERVCTAHLDGGNLDLNWCEKDNCVYMAGPAVEVFEGIWPD